MAYHSELSDIYQPPHYNFFPAYPYGYVNYNQPPIQYPIHYTTQYQERNSNPSPNYHHSSKQQQTIHKLHRYSNKDQKSKKKQFKSINYSEEQIRHCKTLYIGNLSQETKEKEISDFFGGYWNGVRSVNIVLFLDSKVSKQYGYVYFDTHDQAEIALKSKQRNELNGHKVKLDLDVKQNLHFNKLNSQKNENMEINTNSDQKFKEFDKLEIKKQIIAEKEEQKTIPYQLDSSQFPNYNQQSYFTLFNPQFTQYYPPTYPFPPNNMFTNIQQDFNMNNNDKNENIEFESSSESENQSIVEWNEEETEQVFLKIIQCCISSSQ